MILDSHTHIWETWPYGPESRDPLPDARAEQLLARMDGNGVDAAIVICARIGGNDGNVRYALQVARQHPGRFVVFPDLECKWAPDFRTPGAVTRLDQALARWDFTGFTMYLDETEDGSWLASGEGRDFFRLAAEHRLIASLSAMPHQVPAVAQLAAVVPQMPILLHHFAFLGPRSAATANGMELVLAAARQPNIFVKYSGMGNVAASDQRFPYPELADIPRRLLQAFGPGRLLWGSDDPVSRRHMSYAETISLAERHGPLSTSDLPLVMGGNLRRLLETRLATPPPSAP